VFVEKTLASNFYQAKQLCRLSEKANGTDMVGYLRRFYVTFAKAQSLLSEGLIGQVSSFKAYAFSSDFLDASNDDSQNKPPASYSQTGVLEDLGCYAIDLALWFFGDLNIPSENDSSREDSQKSVRFGLENGNGLFGEIESSWSITGYRMPEVGFSIKGSDGSIEVTDDRLELRKKNGKLFKWYRHDLEDNVGFWLGLPEYFREDECFVRSAMKKRRAQPDFASAAKVDRIIELVKNGA
jgi:predicted dehydrogenase